jgi:uncharacterized membrane protein
MTYLVLAILIWSIIHFIPAAATGMRSSLVKRIGLMPYKGVFALLALGALWLIISNWGQASARPLYTPPGWGAYLTTLLTFVASIMFFAPYIDNNIRRVVRNPQLTGVVFWGIGHLCANGEARSLVVFGGLAVWALLEIVLLNRRDGSWIKPGKVPLMADFKLLLTGAGFFAMVFYLHSWLFGTGPIPHLSS